MTTTTSAAGPRPETPTHPYEPLLTIEQVADWLNVPVETVRYWRKMGTGPTATKVVGAVRFRRDHVEQFLEASTERPPSQGTRPTPEGMR